MKFTGIYARIETRDHIVVLYLDANCKRPEGGKFESVFAFIAHASMSGWALEPRNNDGFAVMVRA